jgi:hypothetical protein
MAEAELQTGGSPPGSSRCSPPAPGGSRRSNLTQRGHPGGWRVASWPMCPVLAGLREFFGCFTALYAARQPKNSRGSPEGCLLRPLSVVNVPST